MIEVAEGDITLLDVDAIVNAANATLLGGATALPAPSCSPSAGPLAAPTPARQS